MNAIRTAAAIGVAASLCACGGGGSDDGTSPGNPTGTTTTYSKTAPVANARDTFATAVVDDENNTINGGYEETVTAVNADGSYTLHQDDPSGNTLTVDGVVYHFDDQVLQFDAQGNETSYTGTRADGGAFSCTIAQTGGHPLPWYVGQAWSQTSTISCAGGGTDTITETGTVVAVESVTVPAGTFQALKQQLVITQDTPGGTHIVETRTGWRDPAHSLFLLKSSSTFQYSGSNVPAHHAVGKTIELTARSN